jgi:hypothetical protein
VDIAPLKDAYWTIVTDCLERFHGYSPSAAVQLSLKLRDVIESPRHQDAPPPGYDSESFFHAEPFHVACDLAGRELDLTQHKAAYDALAAQRYFAAEELLRRPAQDSAREYARL